MNIKKIKKLIEKFERSKTNVKFTDLQKFLEELGYTLNRIKGSHLIYTKKGFSPFPIQPNKHDNSKAKSYQVTDAIKMAQKILGEE